jgi:ADP-ribose pyrophosphatase
MKIIKRKTAYDGHYKIDKLTVSDGENTFEREVFERGNAVAALVLDTEKNVFVFVKQFRPAVEADLVEVVAGMLDQEDDSPEATIRREIGEEMGYAVDRLEPIGEFYASPGGSSEKIHLYYAEVNHKTGEGGGLAEENESIELVEVPKAQLADHKSKIKDAKSLVGIYWWLSRQTHFTS